MKPYRKGTTKFDLDEIFRREKERVAGRKIDARIEALLHPPPRNDLADINAYVNRKDNVVKYPHGERYFPPLPDVGDEEEEHDIGWAVEQMCQGLYVTRTKYPDHHLGLQEPDAHSANTLPYFFVVDPDGAREPWFARGEDLLALDWELVDE